MALTLRQVTGRSAGAGNYSHTFAAPCLAGSLIVAYIAVRGGVTLNAPAGFDAHPGGIIQSTNTLLTAYLAGAAGGEQAISFVFTGGPNNVNRMALAEFTPPDPLDLIELLAGGAGVGWQEANGTLTAGGAGGSAAQVTPPAGNVDLLLVNGYQIVVSDAGSQTCTPDADTTELDDGKAAAALHPLGWLGYRNIALTDGSAVDAGLTCTQGSRAYSQQALAFISSPVAPPAFTGEPGGGVW